MTAQIAASARFRNVWLRYIALFPSGVGDVAYTTDTDPPVSYRISSDSGSADDLDTDESDTLAVLQEIWASADGFRDADGDPVSVELAECPYTTDIGELESYGLWNPFDAGSWARWKARQKIGGAFQADGELSEDGDTGRPTVSLGMDIGSVPRVPSGSTYDVDGITDVNVIPVDADSFILNILIDPSFGWENLAAIDPARAPHQLALEKLLRDGMAASPPDADEHLHSDFAAYANINVDWEQASGSTVRFQFHGSLTYGVNADGHLTSFSATANVTSNSPAAYDEDLVQAYIDTAQVTLDVDGAALEPTQTGRPQSHLRGARLYLDDGSYLERVDGHLVDNHLDGTVRRRVRLTNRRAVDIADIAVATGDTYKRVPVDPYVNEVYLAADATADEDIQLPLPSAFVGLKDQDRPLKLHNKSAARKIRVRDWSGTHFGTVYGGELIPCEMAQYETGAGEFHSVRPVERRFHDIMEAPSLVDYRDQTTRLRYGSDDYIYQLPAHAVDSVIERTVVTHHDDEFETGTAAISQDTDFETATAAALLTQEALKVKAAGTLRATFKFTFRGSGGGTMSTHEVDIWRLRDTVSGGVTTTARERFSQTNLAPLDGYDTITPLLVYDEAVLADDVFCPAHLYDDGSGLADVRMSVLERILVLRRDFRVEYTP